MKKNRSEATDIYGCREERWKRKETTPSYEKLEKELYVSLRL